MTTEELLREVDKLMTGRPYMFSHQVMRNGDELQQMYSVWDMHDGQFYVNGVHFPDMLLSELRHVLNMKKVHI